MPAMRSDNIRGQDVDLDALQRRVNEKQAEANRAIGARDAAMEKLKTEFGCKTIAQAQKKLEELTKEAADKETVFVAAYAAYIEKHGEE